MSLVTSSEPRTVTMPPVQEADLVIRLEDVTVRYVVTPERIGSLKEYVIRCAQRRRTRKEFFALRDLSLEIHRGETLGIIGRNGAGKSTLLKVIARVIRPNAGRLWVRGRVAPLIELGAGFHPELTGRENVFLNGTLLGHTRREIDERFDEIVGFADLWGFIDAPLRTYSTGMIARLGFSVATGWVPDILILDEVLSVGDAEFQLKSTERIQRMRGEGTTVLFVSHSPEAIRSTCDRGLWLDHGHVIAQGTADAVAWQYREDMVAGESKRLAQPVKVNAPVPPARPHTIEVVGVHVRNARGEEQTIFHSGESLVLSIDYHAHDAVVSPIFGIAIHRHDGLHISGPNTSFGGLTLPTLKGRGTITYTIPFLPLLEGLYDFSVAVVNQDDTRIFDYHDRLYRFRIVSDHDKNQERYGLLTLRGEWKHDSSPD